VIGFGACANEPFIYQKGGFGLILRYTANAIVVSCLYIPYKPIIIWWQVFPVTKFRWVTVTPVKIKVNLREEGFKVIAHQ
jgi:hypothetical protein